ncbi:MAG: hypothetical protein ACOYYS_27740 [Chloroflexota bacterium]
MDLVRALIYCLVLIGPLLWFQRLLHRHVQASLLLITRRTDLAIMLFSLIFLPGVALHELSHFVTARLLRVSTGRISLIPAALPDGRLQLGYVETAPSDFVRDALIGAAPFLTGGLAVAFIGLTRLHFDQAWQPLAAGQLLAFLRAAAGLTAAPDFWLWFYLAFTISSTMLPSASDQRAWLPLILSLVLLVALAWIAGAGPWMLQHAAPFFIRVLHALAVTLGISVALHGVLLLPAWGLQALLGRLTGMRVA